MASGTSTLNEILLKTQVAYTTETKINRQRRQWNFSMYPLTLQATAPICPRVFTAPRNTPRLSKFLKNGVIIVTYIPPVWSNLAQWSLDPATTVVSNMKSNLFQRKTITIGVICTDTILTVEHKVSGVNWSDGQTKDLQIHIWQISIMSDGYLYNFGSASYAKK